MALLTSNIKLISQQKILSQIEDHFIIRRVIHKENITILNVCASNNRALKYMSKN